MTEYVIRFDYPDAGPVERCANPVYAGIHKGALGWAPSLETAKRFASAAEAGRYLANGYGASRAHGVICEVDGSGEVVPVE